MITQSDSPLTYPILKSGVVPDFLKQMGCSRRAWVLTPVEGKMDAGLSKPVKCRLSGSKRQGEHVMWMWWPCLPQKTQLDLVSVEEEGTPQCTTFLHDLILGKGDVLYITCSLPGNADLHGLHQRELQILENLATGKTRRQEEGVIGLFIPLTLSLWGYGLTVFLLLLLLSSPFSTSLLSWDSKPFFAFLHLHAVAIPGVLLVEFSKLCLHLCKDSFY